MHTYIKEELRSQKCSINQHKKKEKTVSKNWFKTNNFHIKLFHQIVFKQTKSKHFLNFAL